MTDTRIGPWILGAALIVLGASASPRTQAPQEVIAPGDNLHVEGIPPIPAPIAAEVKRYTESRPANLGSWHPVRREILITTRFAETNQVHRVAMPGGARTQLTFFPDRVSGASYPPADRGFFVFSKDTGGDEWFQNYRYDDGTGAVTLLTDGKSRNSLGVWSKDGRRMAYTSTRRTGKDSDIYVIDPADPASNRLVLQVEGGGWSVAGWAPDGGTLLLSNLVSVNESSLHLVEVESGRTRQISAKSAVPVAYLSAKYGGDGRIYVTSDREAEFQRLAVLDPETGREQVLVSGLEWDVEMFDVAPDGRTIAYAVNEDGTNRLHLLDVASGRSRGVEGLPAGVFGGVRFHPNSTDVAVKIEAARTPGDVYSVDAVTRKVERWTFSETGGLNPGQFSEPALIRWKSFDGRMISGYLYRPPSSFTGRRPVIVNIHGGPESQYQPGYLGRNNYWLNELGIATIFPNVRGSTGYGKTFVALDNGLKREDSYKDIAALLDWIATEPTLDPARVMVAGGSYGGFMSYAVATNYADRIACSISFVGISNLRTFLEKTEDYRRDLRRVEYGDERDPEVRAFMERTAAVNNADRITKPMFVVQGKNDPRVPWTESQQIVDTMKRRGAPVWYMLANDEGHGFAKKQNSDFMFYASILFVKKHLLGDAAR
jgi:dipeptidyl aminopeptidase/acylaminoacyl peptidase